MQATNISPTTEFNYPKTRAVPIQAKTPTTLCALEPFLRNAAKAVVTRALAPAWVEGRSPRKDARRRVCLHPSGNSGIFLFIEAVVDWGLGSETARVADYSNGI